MPKQEHETVTQPESNAPRIIASEPINQQLELGIKYWHSTRFPEAEACFQQVLLWHPDNPDAWHLLGVIAAQQKQYPTAIDRINHAIELKPESATFYSNLGNAYREQGQFQQAIECYEKVIQLQPHNAEAHKHLGVALKEHGKLEESIQAFKQALQLKPDDADAYYYLGYTLRTQGKLKEAIASYQKALEIKPEFVIVHSNLLLILHYSSDHEPSAIYAEHRKWAERHAKPLAAAISPHSNERNPERRLRLGYVSGDFKTHSVAYFLEPLLANYNRSDFEVICYANNAATDATSQRLRQMADGWREIHDLADEQVAEMVRRDKIDILVDLSGHSAGNRMLVFARKPAPVQVSYIGYPNTTGLDTIDYRLTDAWADPVGKTEYLHTEQLVRLPHGFLCYLPLAKSPEVSPPQVLISNQITFGCFNNLAKINPELIGCWAEILKSVPNSRLILKSKPLVDPNTCNYLYGLFQEQGIESDRIELLGWMPNQTEHLRLYKRIDIALDTFPYNGTATTCEAMWMGVPVITQAGQTHVSRVGVSLLSSVGLEELIAQSREEYIQMAVALASDKERLQELRANLRSRMQAAPLTNASEIARSLEEAYRTMWRGFCESSISGDDNPVESRKLHIGGTVRVPGWEVLNALPSPHVDHLGNANDLSRFPDHTFSDIYASHVVEHFDYVNELAATLKEWYRVLVPGGKVYISVPDLDVLARLFLDKQQLTVQDRFRVMRMMFGGHVSPYDYHQVGLNQELLTDYLQGVGFTQIQQVEKFGIFNDTSNGRFKGVPISLNVIAQKPRHLSSESRASVDQDLRMAINHHQTGRLPEAIAGYQQVLQQHPENADAWHLLGVIAAQTGQHETAIERIKHAISLNSQSPSFYQNLGNVYQELGQISQSIERYRKAIELNPDFVDAYKNMGMAYKKQGQLPEAMLNYGIYHHKQGQYQQAIAFYQEAIQLQPDFAVAHYNLGSAYKDRGQLSEAIPCFEQAIQLKSDYVDAHLSKGLTLLLLGDYQQGLLEYEWRLETQQFDDFKQLKVPMWDGEPLEGKSIVLGNEQGLGDAIQFVRYAPRLRKQGARVILSTPPALVSLFGECLEGRFEVLEEGRCNIYDYDCHVSLMSLPRLFQTNLETIPDCTPYIFPPKAVPDRCILPSSHAYRIGIVWATGKLNAKLYQQKSFSPELFMDLLDLGNLSLYSLQVGDDASQIEPWLNHERVHDLSPLLQDLADTACFIEQLDLVITADTAVAHLAGAMGKPVWVLLPFVPDWRWLLERQDSPWYPTMRLFRQPKKGDWASVFQQVNQKLQAVLEGESPFFVRYN